MCGECNDKHRALYRSIGDKRVFKDTKESD